MGEWIQHNGGECPVNEGKTVEVESAGGWTVKGPAFALRWSNVLRYRIIDSGSSERLPKPIKYSEPHVASSSQRS